MKDPRITPSGADKTDPYAHLRPRDPASSVAPTSSAAEGIPEASGPTTAPNAGLPDRLDTEPLNPWRTPQAHYPARQETLPEPITPAQTSSNWPPVPPAGSGPGTFPGPPEGSVQRSASSSGKKTSRWLIPVAVGIFALLVGFSAGETSAKNAAQTDLDAAWSENYELQDELEDRERQIQDLQEQLSGLDTGSGAGTSTDPMDPYSLDPWLQGTPTYEDVVPGTGEYVVGYDVLEGTYATEGGESCAWVVVNGTPDSFTEQTSEGPAEITLTSQDFLFTTSGCSDWVRQG